MLRLPASRFQLGQAEQLVDVRVVSRLMSSAIKERAQQGLRRRRDVLAVQAAQRGVERGKGVLRLCEIDENSTDRRRSASRSLASVPGILQEPQPLQIGRGLAGKRHQDAAFGHAERRLAGARHRGRHTSVCG